MTVKMKWPGDRLSWQLEIDMSRSGVGKINIQLEYKNITEGKKDRVKQIAFRLGLHYSENYTANPLFLELEVHRNVDNDTYRKKHQYLPYILIIVLPDPVVAV